MKEIDLEEILPSMILRYRAEPFHLPVFLTMPGNLPKLHWPDDSLGRLIRASLDLLAESNQAQMPIRLAVLKRQHLEDLKDLLEFEPLCWIQFRMEAQFPDLSQTTVFELPEKIGFCPTNKWQKDSDWMLLAYGRREGDSSPAFLLWLQRHKASGTYSLLIPVLDPPVQG